MNKAARLLTVSTFRIVGIFIILDLLAIALFFLYSQEILESRFFKLARDRGFAEIVQYLKFGVIIQVLVVWHRLRPSKLIFAWLILFVIMLSDDAAGIHEAVGKILMTLFSLPEEVNGIRIKDIAEVMSFALFEGIACLYVLYCYFRAPADLKRYSNFLVLAMVPLFFCGIILDILHFSLLEQVGEMASMSILLAFVHRYFSRYVLVPRQHFLHSDQKVSEALSCHPTLMLSSRKRF